MLTGSLSFWMSEPRVVLA